MHNGSRWLLLGVVVTVVRHATRALKVPQAIFSPLDALMWSNATSNATHPTAESLVIVEGTSMGDQSPSVPPVAPSKASAAWALALATADAAVVDNNQTSALAEPPGVDANAADAAELPEQLEPPKDGGNSKDTTSSRSPAPLSLIDLGLPIPSAAPPTSSAPVKAKDAMSPLPLSFTDWKQVLETHISSHIATMKHKLGSMQDLFDQQSLHTRGDFNWRKQILIFHGQIQRLVDQNVHQMTLQLQEDLRKLSQTVESSLDQVLKQSQHELESTRHQHDQRISNTRYAMKKEMQQFTILEKCLRREEVHRAKSHFEDQLHQLQQHQEQQERELRDTLRDVQSAYSTLQLQNDHLELCLQEAKQEIARLRKTVAHYTLMNDGGSANGIGPNRRGTATDAYVQSLRAALNAVNQQCDALKSQLEETTLEKNAVAKKLKGCEDALSRVQEDHVRAKQLLSDAHSELQSQQQHHTRLQDEIALHKATCSDLQFQNATLQLQLQDAQRLNDAAKQRIACLQHQIDDKSKALDQLMECQLEQLAGWEVDGDHETASPGSSACSSDRVAKLLSHWRQLQSDLTLNEVKLTQQIETRLRFEFEARFSSQLNNRVSHERKRTLARVETHCTKNAVGGSHHTALHEYASLMRRTTKGHHRGSVSEVCAKSLQQIVNDAYNDLGLGDWSSTDVESLQSQIAGLQQHLADQRQQIQSLTNQLDQCKLLLAKDELVHKEKDTLLAELLGKHRELRSQYDALRAPTATPSDASMAKDLELEPLTVYGLHPPMSVKRRVRPVSASPCLAGGTRHVGTGTGTGTGSSVVPPSSSMAAIRRSMAKAFLTDHVPKPQQLQDHVRCSLKDELLLRGTPPREEQEEQQEQQDNSPRKQSAVAISDSTSKSTTISNSATLARSSNNEDPVFGKEGVLQMVRRRRGRSATLVRPHGGIR